MALQGRGREFESVARDHAEGAHDDDSISQSLGSLYFSVTHDGDDERCDGWFEQCAVWVNSAELEDGDEHVMREELEPEVDGHVVSDLSDLVFKCQRFSDVQKDRKA